MTNAWDESRSDGSPRSSSGGSPRASPRSSPRAGIGVLSPVARRARKATELKSRTGATLGSLGATSVSVQVSLDGVTYTTMEQRLKLYNVQHVTPTVIPLCGGTALHVSGVNLASSPSDEAGLEPVAPIVMLQWWRVRGGRKRLRIRRRKKRRKKKNRLAALRATDPTGSDVSDDTSDPGGDDSAATSPAPGTTHDAAPATAVASGSAGAAVGGPSLPSTDDLPINGWPVEQVASVAVCGEYVQDGIRCVAPSWPAEVKADDPSLYTVFVEVSRSSGSAFTNDRVRIK